MANETGGIMCDGGTPYIVADCGGFGWRVMRLERGAYVIDSVAYVLRSSAIMEAANRNIGAQNGADHDHGAYCAECWATIETGAGNHGS